MSSEIELFSDRWADEARRVFFPKLPDREAIVFMTICKARRLNPFTKQVYFLPYTNKKTNVTTYSMIVSIDGFRSLAARTGLYGGQDEPIYTYDKNERLVSCKIAVYRKDFDRPTVAVAHLSEYVQYSYDGSVNKTWAKSPHIMLAKCAEALALRKAFPDELGGLHEESEMGAVVDGETIEQPPPEAPQGKTRTEQLLNRVKKVEPKPTPQEAEIVESQAVVDAPIDDVPPPTDDDAPPPSAPKSIDHYAQQVLAKLGGNTRI